MDDLIVSIRTSLTEGKLIDPEVFEAAFEYLVATAATKPEGTWVSEVVTRSLDYYRQYLPLDGAGQGVGQEHTAKRTELLDKLAALKREVERLPYVHVAYAVGFPIYGFPDVRRRMFLSLMRFLEGSLPSWHTAKQILPDHDLVLIYDLPGVKLCELSSASPKLFHTEWLDHLAGEGKRSWEALTTRLASSGVSRVNIWGPALVRDEAVEYADYIKEFLTSGHMVLDVAWPTPKPVWNNLPAFVRDEDDQIIEILRDFLISDGLDLAYETQQVVEGYRRNVLLFGLRGSPLSEQQLFQAIADRFERRIATPVFSPSPEVRETFVKRFRAVTNRALQEGLVSRTVEGELTLTALGRAYLAQVLEWRDALLVRGYVTEANVVDVEL